MIFLQNIMIDHQKLDTFKVQLTMAINFISSKDTDEDCLMHSKIDNIEVTTYDGPKEIIEDFFESLLSRYKIGSETQMRVINLIFDCVNLMYYSCHKIGFTRSVSYIGSPDWIKKAIINPNK